MDTETLRQAERLFKAVRTLPPAEQAAHLDAHCGDAAVRAEVDNLLEGEGCAGDHLVSSPSPAVRIEPAPAIRSLWEEAETIWERYRKDSTFRAFVAADYGEVYQALHRLKGRAVNLLEWGSGLGVVTIMASTLGFDAYGIESEATLVDWSRKLAHAYAPEAQFFAGSFVPDEYEWNLEHGDDLFYTEVAVGPAYEDLDLELRDFDLVYAYPWPDEHPLYNDIMRQCGGENALFLTYDAREGMLMTRPGRER